MVLKKQGFSRDWEQVWKYCFPLLHSSSWTSKRGRVQSDLEASRTPMRKQVKFPEGTCREKGGRVKDVSKRRRWEARQRPAVQESPASDWQMRPIPQHPGGSIVLPAMHCRFLTATTIFKTGHCWKYSKEWRENPSSVSSSRDCQCSFSVNGEPSASSCLDSCRHRHLWAETSRTAPKWGGHGESRTMDTDIGAVLAPCSISCNSLEEGKATGWDPWK